MAFSPAEWIALGSLALAVSGINLGGALRSWIKSRDILNDRLDQLRSDCREDSIKLEGNFRGKFSKAAKAFKAMGRQVHRLTELTNEMNEDVYQIKQYLQVNHSFSPKSKPERLECLDPFDSLDLETTDNADYSKP